MYRSLHKVALTLALAVACGTGCHPMQPFYFGEDGDLSHYMGVATEIDYPESQQPVLPDAKNAGPPLTLENANFDEFWEISLEDAIKITLANSKVLRNLGGRIDTTSGIASPSDQMLSNPDALQSIYSPAIQESSPGFVNGLRIGPEAALAEFDTQLSSSFFWEKVDEPQNIRPGIGLLIPQTNVQDIGTFQAQLTKTNATGGTTSLSTTTVYDQSNNPRRLFASDYRTNIQGEFRQPLLQGLGVEYNRIAGPFNEVAGVGTRTYDGVVIARIHTDRALADFEAGVRNLVSDVQDAYWELYFAYRNLDARKVGLQESLKTWENVQARTVAGLADGGAESEGLIREQYFGFRAASETAKSDVFSAENRLRFLMGLSATDGRLIRPSDDPTMAKVTFHWQDILDESMARNVELRKQKWLIKQRELELIAAKNHLLPRLDAVGRYRWLGFGDDLISANGGGKARFDNAWNTLLHGDYQESQFGVQLTMNIGYRAEMAAVRNAQLNLTRDKAVLEDQENELAHLLTDSVRKLAQHYQLIQTNFNRRVAAHSQVRTIKERMKTQIERTVDLLNRLLEAQRRLTLAETDYYRSLVDYNKTIKQIQFHKGSLLEDNSIFLAEGPWPGKAYFDSLRLARQRDASVFLGPGVSRPQAISPGPYRQLTRPPQGPKIDSPQLLEELPAPEPVLEPTPRPTEPPRTTAIPSVLPQQTAGALSSSIAKALVDSRPSQTGAVVPASAESIIKRKPKRTSGASFRR
ncbi:MAG: TolC family protein [Planctomycetales bacterium]